MPFQEPDARGNVVRPTDHDRRDADAGAPIIRSVVTTEAEARPAIDLNHHLTGGRGHIQDTGEGVGGSKKAISRIREFMPNVEAALP